MAEPSMMKDFFYSGFEPESSGSRIWRYLSLEKFIRCLQQEGFWFSTYDRLGDPWEGTPVWESIQQGFAPILASMIEAIDKSRPGVPPQQQWSDAVAEIRQAIPDYAKPLWDARTSCWHCRPNESHAMWEIYAGRGKGITVCTTIETLVAGLSIPEGFELKVGRVRYTDFDKPNDADLGRWDALFRKWHYFEYESEVRLVLTPEEEVERTEPPDQFIDRGMLVRADLSTVIAEVVMAPGTRESQKQMVENLLSKYGLGHIPVHPSAMAESPEQFVDRMSKRRL